MLRVLKDIALGAGSLVLLVVKRFIESPRVVR